MNVDQIRVFVRTQLDLDEEDLPNPLLDVYIRSGFEQIINIETRWPFYEQMWLGQTAVAGVMPLPAEVREIVSVIGPNGLMTKLDELHVERAFAPYSSSGGATAAQFWSQIGTNLYFWPGVPSPVNYDLRGFRQPTDWVSQGAGAEVDADTRLHLPLVWYCCAVAYAQQEDEVLEQTYMNRFRDEATRAAEAVMRVWTGQPKILNAYRSPAGEYQPVRPPVVFNVPGP